MIELAQANGLMIPLRDGCIHCVVTSPPYWGLRDYGVEGQLGLEATPEEYVERMVEVFREVRRALHPSGTVWLNLGDSYSTGSIQATGYNDPGWIKTGGRNEGGKRINAGISGLKPKDMVGIPWRVAFALQADGWWLRSDIIWSKPNPMPESVTDRPTKAHEYMFLLSKCKDYFYDQEAVREPQSEGSLERFKYGNPGFDWNSKRDGCPQFGSSFIMLNGRNRRTVWEIATQPYSGAHFATYPEKLVEPCIKAGSSEKGCCPKCGAPWERVVEKGYRAPAQEDIIAEMIAKGVPRQKANLYGNPTRDPKLYAENPDKQLGWQPTCFCEAGDPVPCMVLDPFVGSGTTLVVARRLGRNGVGLDLSFAYLQEQARVRLGLEDLQDWYEGNGMQEETQDLASLPMFGLRRDG